MSGSFIDAFGRQLWDHLHAGYPYQIIERSDGRIEALPVDIYFRDYPEWHEPERNALYLQSQGLEVLGIDQSPLAIEVCRERGMKDALVLPVSRIRALRGRRFDTFLMLGHNLGLLGSETSGKRLL